MQRIAQLVARSSLAAMTLAATAWIAAAQQPPKLAFEKYALANGLEVILHEDHSVPLVAVNIWFKVGSGDEERGRTGFAHLFEHVMFMGSQNAPYGQFDAWLEAAGGNNNGSTTQDRTNYFEVMPSNALPLALWLEADRMGWMLPTMDQQKLDVQRDVVKNERRQRVDNAPYGRADETIKAALYPPAHPYSWPVIGSMADLTAGTLTDVTTFFKTYYAPNNATLIIAGDFKPAEVKRMVERYFAEVPRGPDVPARPTIPEFKLARDTVLVLEDRVELPRLYYAWDTVKLFHPDDAALDILAYVLAGDKNSRLFKRLVYELQVAQDVTAYQESGRLDGSFQIWVTPKPGEAPSKIAKIVDEEIGKLLKGDIAERDILRARNTTHSRQLDGLASVLGKADQLNLYNYFAGTPDYTAEDYSRYDRVSTADVVRVATTYLGAPKVVLTVVPTGKRSLMVTGGAR